MTPHSYRIPFSISNLVSVISVQTRCFDPQHIYQSTNMGQPNLRAIILVIAWFVPVLVVALCFVSFLPDLRYPFHVSRLGGQDLHKLSLSPFNNRLIVTYKWLKPYFLPWWVSKCPCSVIWALSAEKSLFCPSSTLIATLRHLFSQVCSQFDLLSLHGTHSLYIFKDS